MTGRAALAALAVLLGAGPAGAYVRTASEGTGIPIAWPLPAIPYHVNRSFPGASPSCQATPTSDPTLEVIQRSFAEWERPCTDLRLLYAGMTGELRTGVLGRDENVVIFRRGWCSQRPEVVADPCYSDWDVDCGSIYGCFEDHASCAPGQGGCATRSVVALTSVLYDPSTGRILSADIELNAWDGEPGSVGSAIGGTPARGWYFTCEPARVSDPPDACETTHTCCATLGGCCTTYGQDGCFSMDLQSTLTHEVGHFLGLAHSIVAGATMNAQTGGREISKRDLSADDVAGICAVYPPASGGCGCGAPGAAGTLSLLLAALALRPGRRRSGGAAGAHDTTSPA